MTIDPLAGPIRATPTITAAAYALLSPAQQAQWNLGRALWAGPAYRT